MAVVDSSGIQTQDPRHFRASGRRSNQLSYLLLLLLLLYDDILHCIIEYKLHVSMMVMVIYKLKLLNWIDV